MERYKPSSQCQMVPPQLFNTSQQCSKHSRLVQRRIYSFHKYKPCIWYSCLLSWNLSSEWKMSQMNPGDLECQYFFLIHPHYFLVKSGDRSWDDPLHLLLLLNGLLLDTVVLLETEKVPSPPSKKISFF